MTVRSEMPRTNNFYVGKGFYCKIRKTIKINKGDKKIPG
jgi:hypothetical protein